MPWPRLWPGTHTSKRGRRRGSDISRQRGPLRRQRPGPRDPRGERACGGGGSPAERPSSRRADPPRRCPRGGAGEGEGKGRGTGGRARPRRCPGAALQSAGCPGDVAVRADALITRRQRRRRARPAQGGREPRGGAVSAPRRHLGGGSRSRRRPGRAAGAPRAGLRLLVSSESQGKIDTESSAPNRTIHQVGKEIWRPTYD